MENFIKVAVPKFPQDELSERGAASGSLVWKLRVNDVYDWLKIRWMSRLWWPWATGAEVEVGGWGWPDANGSVAAFCLCSCISASFLTWICGIIFIEVVGYPGVQSEYTRPSQKPSTSSQDLPNEARIRCFRAANVVADTIGSREHRPDGGRCGSLLRQIDWPRVETVWCLRKQNHNPVHARHSSWRQHFEPRGPPQLSVELSYRKLSKLKVHPWSWY